ncbi:MAG: asparagine synthase (glutamine-hydrolyzing) [Actinomycetota bacterium]|nr:asparagine synthase (glutamine-hydrolyzing) [Actinomycetota bacterium]
MCGIYGELCLSPAARPHPAGETAVDRLAHRGPDERGTWRGDGVFLGARRLSVVDPAGGRQPMWSADGAACIVYNGELYNAPELRRELDRDGRALRTRSDTEVVLAAYLRWGPDCFERLNGMFALAVWDTRSRSLMLARDRIGEKPLYVYRDTARLVFASEIKAILAHPEVPRRLDPRGLANFLAFGHAVAPRTILEGVEKLLPGHLMLVRSGEVGSRRWWEVGDEVPVAPDTEVEAAELVRELLDDSVRRRLVADVPVGAFLSGGLDSTAVTALMARHASGPVKTFSLGFEGPGPFNELADARRAARRLGTEHHEIEAGAGEVEAALRTLVYHYDEPFGDPAGLGVYLLSRLARPHVTVALTGDGGDELFGGYRRYVADRLAPLYQRLPDLVGRRLLPTLAGRAPGLRRVARAAATLPIEDPGMRYARWLRVFTPEMQDELLATELSRAVGDHEPAADYPRLYGGPEHTGPRGDHLNRLMFADVKTWLADGYMEKTDKATMACGLEARMPLLDHRLVELAFAIPARHKIRGTSTKRVLRRAVADLVPPDTRRKRKHGFAVPVGRWLRGELGGFAREVLTDERTRRRGYFDASAVERLLGEHGSRRRGHDDALWLLLNFELWHRVYLDREPV